MELSARRVSRQVGTELQRLAHRLLEAVDVASDVLDMPGMRETADGADEIDLLALARAIYGQRRARDRVFGSGTRLFGEPDWDVLLDLFIAHGTGGDVSVSSACIAACVAPTTALRRVVALERRGLVHRTPDAADRRRSFVALTPCGLSLMRDCLSSMARLGSGRAHDG